MTANRAVPVRPTRRAITRTLAVAALLAACAAPGGGLSGPDRPPEIVRVTETAPDAAPRVLCVVAHPDDEIAFAGTLYATAASGGACDVFTITNGEAGFKYATLAEREHGLDLTLEAVGRRELPEIRKRELAAGCRRLGVRDIHFLREKDHRYTQDLDEVLGDGPSPWDLGRVGRQLDRRLEDGRYDFVLVHLPMRGTHAHHAAATVLAMQAIGRMPLASRPVPLAALTVSDGEAPSSLSDAASGAWPGPDVRLEGGVPAFVFDRRRRFGHQGKLDYRIVVNGAIAEHRSQGTMQLLMNRGDREEYRLLAGGSTDGAGRAHAWFDRLARVEFPVRSYGESAGTNAGPANR